MAPRWRWSLALFVVRSSAAQATHLVKFQADTAAKEYTFEPAVVVAHPHDVLVFKLVNGAPHNITFEAADLSPQAHDALNAALPRRSADLTSPLLTAPGAEYRVVVPSIPPGTTASSASPIGPMTSEASWCGVASTTTSAPHPTVREFRLGFPLDPNRIFSSGGGVVSELGGSQISTLLETLPGIANVLRSPVADALGNVIRAAARLTDFSVADADELIKYATRRGLLGQDEGDRLLAEVHAAEQRRADKAADRERALRAKARAKGKTIRAVKSVKKMKKAAKRGRRR